MAINKELYERYKAMKAAKLQQQQDSCVSTTQETQNYTSYTNNERHSGFSDTNEPVINNITSPDDYSSSYHQEIPTSAPSVAEEYNKSFAYSGNILSSSSVAQEIPEQTQNTNSSLKKFALIGYPLGHSLSEYIHNAGFKSMGINATYEIMPTQPEDLVERIKYLRSNGYTGFNVTIPLKLPVTMFLDEVDKSANIVNAINTVAINPETGLMKGYNTDAIGFINAFPADFPLYGKTAGILGTGGAARAAVTALAQKQVKNIKLYTRNIANCMELLEYLRKTFPNTEFSSHQIDRISDLSDINILVNATPLGMYGATCGYTPVEEPELLTLPPDALVYDIVYNPKKTNFIKIAQKHNYKTITGLDMLIYQALEAEKIWTGHTPDFKDMKIAALENL